MAMLGMKADMQSHYFPGYCSTRDLNLNVSCSIWPLNNVDTVPKNGHYYNGNLASPCPDQYLSYKEKLKQIMLQHEAIFKHQINELHRVYKRQRELMDEMKRIKFYGHHLQLETSPSNKIFPGNSLQYPQKMCKVSALPWSNPAYIPPSVSHAENSQSHLNYLKGKVIHSDCSTVLTEGCREESELPESKFKKVGKKILDLELPASEYLDNEQEESFAWRAVSCDVPNYQMKSTVEDVQKNDVKMSLGIEEGRVVFQDDNMNQASFFMRTKFLADLNEPIKLEEETDPESNDFLSPVSYHREIPCHDLPCKRNSDSHIQQKGTIQNTQTMGDPETFSNVLPQEKNGSSRDCISDNNDKAGQSSSGLNSSPEGTENLSTSSKDDEIEQAHESSTSHLNFQRKRKFVGLESCPGQVAAACKHTSTELVPADGLMTYDSSWRKHTRDVVRAPIAVQALPCFNSSMHVIRSSKLRSIGDNSCFDLNVESKSKFQSPSPQSSFCKGDNEFSSEDNGANEHNKNTVDLNSTRGLDLNSVSPTSSDVAADSTWCTDGEEKCKESTASSHLQKANLAYLAEASEKLELDCNSVPDSKEQLTANKLILESILDQKSSSFGFQVDLNSFFNEDESSPLHSPSSEIRLQAPASPENEEGSPPRGESDENQLETPCILSEQENGDSLEDLVTVAAEAIVLISVSEAQNNRENLTFPLSKSAEKASLYWFAKLASSVVDDPESEFGVVLSCKNLDHQDDCLSDGTDYFEAMTLKLKETKEDEYHCNTNVQNEEVACRASSASQPRRDRTRRGRQQRKDFQSEILPSLASLSRYEVTEDLQVIGGLIEAACRNSGTRTGGNGWTRGRRRRTSISSFKAETSVCSMMKQQTRYGECSIQDWSLMGWGKRTRRRGVQRCPASNPQLILGQI